MDVYAVWCSLEPVGSSTEASRPTWQGHAVAPAKAAIEAAQAFTRGDPKLTPVYCLVSCLGDDKLPTHHEVTAEPTVEWKCRRYE